MRRLALLFTLAGTLLGPTPATAQSDQPRVYAMNFSVNFADIPAWIENHQQHEVPLLDSLIEEGMLQAYDLWVHDTGGTHNLRYNFVLPNWDAVGDFWDAYYARLNPEAWVWLSMIQEHSDEIWIVGDRNIPEGGSLSPVAYESSFLVQYEHLEEWSADFETHGKPALDRALEEGLIEGWAALQHDTGGPWNARYVYWLDSWDAADDAVARIGQIRQELGQTMESARMIRSHADDVWRRVPPSGN